MDEFEIIKVVGKGSYGEVWLAKHKKDKKQYVLKRINLQKTSKKERSSAEQEAKLLQKLKHPNIVSYKESFETPDGMLYIAMQYCEGGDLYTKLKQQKSNLLDERQVVEWFVQIAMALQYMHERNILHRDLKTQNIFLTKSKIIKVGDLGIARVLEGATDMATTLIGTPYYMSPELFSNKPYNHKSDVWALGCCVYEMTTLKHAFNAKDMNSLVYKILKGKLPPMPRQYGSELLDLMKAMLHHDPDKRPSVNRILRDQYIKRNIALFLEETKRGVSRPASAAARQPAAFVGRLPIRSSSGKDPAAIPPRPKAHRPAITPPPQPEPVRPEANIQAEPIIQAIRDEVDSSAVRREADKVTNAGDASVGVFKPGHVRKPSNMASKDLESITENVAVEPPELKESSEDSDRNNTVKVNTVKQKSQSQPQPIPAPKAAPSSPTKVTPSSSSPIKVDEEPNKRKKRKKKLVPNRAPAENRPSIDQEGESTGGSVVSIKSDRSSSARPLPVPKVAVSEGLPQKHDLSPASLPTSSSSPQRSDRQTTSRERDHGADSSSSKSSSLSDGVMDDTPRSMPNMSARDRRRKEKASSSMEIPISARNVKLRKVPSERITKDEKASMPKLKSVHHQRQPSLRDSSSSDESMPIPSENTNEREMRREHKEIDNFINVLDNTLKMNTEMDKSEDEELEEVPVDRLRPLTAPGSRQNGLQANSNHARQSEQLAAASKPPPVEKIRKSSLPVEEPDQKMHKSPSMPSLETLTSTSRLLDRIRFLHKDCVKGVGYPALKKAYDILDHIEEDNVEPKLIELLGAEKFDEYAGKIWQLKFCEESLFMT